MAVCVLFTIALVMWSESAWAGAGEPLLEVATAGVSTRYYSNKPFKKAKRRRTARLGQQLRCDGRCVLRMAKGFRITMGKNAIVRPSSPQFVRFAGDERARRCLVMEVHGAEVTIERDPPAITTNGGKVNSDIAEAPPLIILAAGRRLAHVSGRLTLRHQGNRLAALVGSGATMLDDDGWGMLEMSSSYTITKDDVERRAAPAPPRWDFASEHNRPLAVTDRASSVVSVAWHAAKGVTKYFFETSRTPGFEHVDSRQVVTARTLDTRMTLPVGHHFLRVTSIDEEGFRSVASPVRRVGVTRLTLPAGASMVGRVVTLPPGGEVLLHDADVLELRTLKTKFGKAPNKLTVAGDGVSISLRYRGDRHSRAFLRLEEQRVQALFTMTPFQPIWPWHDIHVSARLANSGKLDVRALDMQLAVFIDGRRIKSRWTRKGDVYRTTIARRYVSHPVLLSVVAQDGSGNELGRSYLEILGARRSVVRRDRRVRHLLKK